MKISTAIEAEKIHFICQGKMTNFLSFKREILNTIRNHKQGFELVFSFGTHPIHPNILGFLLILSKQYSIEVLLSNFTSFRQLKELYLLEKLNIKYQKD